MDNKERFDPDQAIFDSRQKSKPKNAPPHYLRCAWYKDKNRCLLGDGHIGKHNFEEERRG